MSQTERTTSPATKASPWWQRIPLTLQILIALVVAVSVGIALGAGNPNPSNATLINNLAIPFPVFGIVAKTIAMQGFAPFKATNPTDTIKDLPTDEAIAILNLEN